MRKNIDKAKVIFTFLSVLLISLLLLFSYSRVFDEFEYSLLDIRYKLRPDRNVDKNIVIIEIGDDSIEKLGKWPFPRNYHALLIAALESAGVETIVFDIFFSEEKEGDEELAKAVKNSGKVYLPYVFELERTNPDKSRIYASGYAAKLLDIFAKPAKGTGYINVEPDIDGKIRKVPPFIVYDGKLYPHITFLVALAKLGFKFEEIEIVPGKKIALGKDFVIPLDDDSSIMVNYPAKWGKVFRHYSYVDIIQSYLADTIGQEPILDLSELKNAVCFIGLTATAAPDAHPSPLEPLYPGIGVHTGVYDSVISGNFLHRADRTWNLLVLILMWLYTASVTTRSRKRFALLSIFIIIAVFFAVSVILFWPFGIWIDVFYPLVTIAVVYVLFTFRKYVTETQKRELLEKELEIAKEIQESFLPKELPSVGGLDIRVKMVTARQVGGDLYDVVQLDDKRICVMMGDVSGKGVPAALYMARVVSVFKTHVKDGSPVEVITKINNRLTGESSSNLFVTLTFAVFDTEKNETYFAIGGHLPTILIEPDGNVELLDVEMGMPLGMLECDFSEGKRSYKPGSIFVLYTDGVTEAMDTQG